MNVIAGLHEELTRDPIMAESLVQPNGAERSQTEHYSVRA